MNTRTSHSKDVRQLAAHAILMSEEGLKDAILDDWNNPQWPAILFDGMNLALERKIGKKAYANWFNALPVKEA